MRSPVSAIGGPQTRASVRTVIFPALLLCVLVAGCSGEGEGIRVGRETLFSLGYGPGENQLVLFSGEEAAAGGKTRLGMREGMFVISNGPGAKLSRFSSFGDILSMIYDPSRGSAPFVLQTIDSKDGARPADSPIGRFASAHPLVASGEIAVDSAWNLFLEDRTDRKGRLAAPETGDILDSIVLKFDRTGRYRGYLGQEGSGGTPFYPISSIHTNENDDCIVISSSDDAWFVHWFDKRGILVKSLRIGRDALPLPDGKTGLIASLDGIAPDVKERNVIVKIDYYSPTVSGPEYSGSWIHSLSLMDASTVFRMEIPRSGKTGKPGDLSTDDSGDDYSIPAFLGLARNQIFLMSVLSDGSTRISALDRSTRRFMRYDLSILPEETRFASFFLSREGILCALLAGEYSADVVWWRFDKLLFRGLATERSPE